MQLTIKLKKELVDENVTELFDGMRTEAYEHNEWFTLKVFYECVNVNKLSNVLDTVFKEYFNHYDRIGMRIGEMPYVATSDNKNIKAIMKKLLV